MHLVTINVDSVLIGQPLPVSLRDESGVLLASKGFVISNRADLDLMVGRRSQLYIDAAESESHMRAYVGKLHSLVREDKTLGQIADTQFSSLDLDPHHDTMAQGEPNWLDLQAEANTMLRDTLPESFAVRLDRLHKQLSRYTSLNPDGCLFALIHLSSTEVRLYSATHAMLVCVMCRLAAREILKWPAELIDTLGKAALTMNIGMTVLQDRLAQQKEALTPDQQRQIAQHCQLSLQRLAQLGVTQATWLEAVRDHHTQSPGPLRERSEGQQLARLIQRADMFAARLSPRVSRAPESSASAMKACYFDETQQMDEAGAALIKAVGIYSPGTYVRLVTEEVAVVIKRGANTTTPRVAILVNRSGMPTGELIVRDTSKREFRIVTGLPQREVKVQINLERLLQLTKLPTSDRLW
jgi:HD-GYP domain-containing protein (c-di-GMP phosphodiesterase class II)